MGEDADDGSGAHLIRNSGAAGGAGGEYSVGEPEVNRKCPDACATVISVKLKECFASFMHDGCLPGKLP